MPDPTTLNIDIVTKADTSGVEQTRKSFAQLGDEIEQQSKKGAVEGGGASVPGASAGAFGPFGKWVAGLTAAGTAAVLLRKVFSEMAELNPRIGEGMKQIKEALHDALTPDWLRNGAGELGNIVNSINRALGGAGDGGKPYAQGAVNAQLQQVTFATASRREQERMAELARQRLDTLKEEEAELRAILEVEKQINKETADEITRRTSDEKGRVLAREERIKALADQQQKERQDAFDAGERERAQKLRSAQSAADQAVNTFDRDKELYDAVNRVANLRRARDAAMQAYKEDGTQLQPKLDAERYQQQLNAVLARLPRDLAEILRQQTGLSGDPQKQQAALEEQIAKMKLAMETSAFAAGKAIEEKNATAQRLQTESSAAADAFRIASEAAQRRADADIKVASSQTQEADARGRLAADSADAATKLQTLRTQLENLAQRVNSAPLADALRTVAGRMDTNASERDFTTLMAELRRLMQSNDQGFNAVAGRAFNAASDAQSALNAARSDQAALDNARMATDAAKTEGGLRTAADDVKVAQTSRDEAMRNLQQHTQDLARAAQDIAAQSPELAQAAQALSNAAAAGDSAAIAQQISEFAQTHGANQSLLLSTVAALASQAASDRQRVNELQQQVIGLQNRSTDN